MKYNNIVRKQDGFSLIELMVVVAIIGVLAAIAIPQLDGFRQKARASEAKTSLGSLYTSERAYFYEASEYSDVLATIGFARDGSNNLYNVGFTTGSGNFSPATNPLAPGTKCKVTTAGPAAATTGTPTVAAFKAGAFGSTDALGALHDGYEIDDQKLLTNGASGALVADCS